MKSQTISLNNPDYPKKKKKTKNEYIDEHFIQNLQLKNEKEKKRKNFRKNARQSNKGKVKRQNNYYLT